VQLDCGGGRACPKCRKCRDWYDPGLFSPYMKRDNATCSYGVVGFFYLFLGNGAGAGDLNVIYHLCQCRDWNDK
jgi:hypothetical protein